MGLWCLNVLKGSLLKISKPRRFLIFAIGFICFFILSFTLILVGYNYSVVLNEKEPVVFIVKPGDSFQKIAGSLHAQGMIKRPFLLKLLAQCKGQTRHVQAGEYNLPQGITVGEFLNLLSKGEVIQHGITFIEGWHFQQVLTALQANPWVKQTLHTPSPAEVMIRLGYGNLHPEGRFFPSTYFFPKGTTDTMVLLKAFNTMNMVLQKAWEHRDRWVPYSTPYEALIAASLIEKETSIEEERALIAGVIVNRLNQYMPLQMDPTVIYGLGDNFNGHLIKADLRKPTPYNTYVHLGLPPTPISMPSESALYAALHPKGNFLYYVAKGDGGHLFSVDLAHHNEAVSCYQRKIHWPNCTIDGK